MRRLTLAASLVLAVAVPGVATARPRADHQAPVRHGQRCVRPDGSPVLYTVAMDTRAARAVYGDTTPATNHEHAMLHRLATCQRVPPATRFAVRFNRTQAHAQYVRLHPPDATPAPASGLVKCIVDHETSPPHDPQTVNSSDHMGIGQWAESTWLADGGGRYAHTPLGATYNEQLQIIEDVVAGRVPGESAHQWTDFDPC